MKRFHFAPLLLTALLIATAGCSSLVSLSTSEPIKDDPQERSFGRYVNDEIIEVKAEVNLKKIDKALAKSNIHVVSFNGIVLATGQVNSEANKALAEKTLSEIKEVRRVHNALTVAPNASWAADSSDFWISTKLKSKMVFSGKINSSKIEIITEKGVVYLMGLVTKQEADAATEIARRTAGVQKVVRIFEYI